MRLFGSWSGHGCESKHALHTATCGWEKGKYVVPSTDGHGELPQRQIDEGLARDALVHYGFDNDAGGATLWAQVTEAYPRRGHRAQAAAGRGE